MMAVATKNIRKLFFWIVILTALFIRVLSLFISDNFHGIAAGKVLAAQMLLEHPNSVYSWIVPAHGPIHMYLVAVMLKLFGHPFFTPRLLSLFMGIAFFFPYYYLLKILFNEETALICSFVIAFYPLHIVYSVLSTAESTFVFFLFLGIFFYARHIYNNIKEHLILAAFFIGISSICRFEGGLFICILSIMLIRDWKKFLLFLSVASLLPVIWMIFNYLFFGNPMFFLKASDAIVHTEFNYLRFLGEKVGILRKILFWPLELYDYFGLPVFCLGIIGLLGYGWRKKYRLMFVLFCLMLVFFIWKTVKEELAMQPRYGISLGLLFLPFFAQGVMAITGYLKGYALKIFMIFFFLFIIFRGTYINFLMLPHTPAWIIETAKFLHEHVQKGDFIFVEAEEDNYKEPIKLLAKVDLKTFVDFEGFFQHVELMEPSKRAKLKYIVMISPKELSSFKEVFKTDNCKIYMVR